jgi:hypothetical protein
VPVSWRHRLGLVIGGQSRDCREEPDRNREKRLRYARRDDRKRGIARCRDRAKYGHDAPNHAVQTDEGTGRGDRRQHQKAGFVLLDFARYRNVEDFLDS